jgi:hypothetical protein
MRCNHWKMVFGVAFAALLSVLPNPAFACSAVACIGGGPEMRGDFLVVVKHDGKPLPGVSVRVTSSSLVSGYRSNRINWLPESLSSFSKSGA